MAGPEQRRRRREDRERDAAHDALVRRVLGEGEPGFERYLRATFDEMFEGIQIVGFDGRYLYANATAAEHGRRNRWELIGRRMTEVYPGIEGTAMYARLQLCLREREPQVLVNEFVHPEGGTSWFNLRMSPVPVGALILSIDVTAEKRAEEQLRAAQRLDAIGRLAGGVAHDFNNLLTVIAGYSDMVLRDMGEQDPFRFELQEIREASERGAALTRQLLAFSRKQRYQPEPLDLNEVLVRMERLVQRLIGEDIQLGTRTAPQPARVLGDRSQLEQVIMNLAVNARDAMPGGGRLTIQTDHVELDEAYAQRHGDARPGPHVLLAVSDTGVGMDEQTRVRLFEPFFTTKEPGKGAGLGLATVYGIVRQNGGNIWVYSEPGQGTTFKVYLPALADEAELRPVAPAVPAVEPGGCESVLLVEDDAAVRRFVRNVLEGSGYAVSDTGDPQEALRLLAAAPRDFDLLLTDVVLTGLGGGELAESALALNPELHVIMMSGYTEDAILGRGELDPRAAFIDKPVAASFLLRRVREVLAGTPG